MFFKNFRNDYKRKHLEYCRQKTLVNLIKQWLETLDEKSVPNRLKHDVVAKESFKSTLSFLLENRKELFFKRIAKTLDWTNPNVSLVVEFRLSELVDKKNFKTILLMAEQRDSVYRQEGTIASFKTLHDPKRSSNVDDVAKLLHRRPSGRIELSHIDTYRKLKSAYREPPEYKLDFILAKEFKGK